MLETRLSRTIAMTAARLFRERWTGSVKLRQDDRTELRLACAGKNVLKISRKFLILGRNGQIKSALPIQPEFWTCPEISRKTKRGIRRDAPHAAHDPLDARTRHIERLCQLSGAQTVRIEKLLFQNLSGMYGVCQDSHVSQSQR